MTFLGWLPDVQDWRSRLQTVSASHAGLWVAAVTLANTRLDFVRTNALDETVLRMLDGEVPEGPAKAVRLALLGSSTTAHLVPSIRIAGLRRGIPIIVYEADYGQYWQELADPNSALYAFKPTAVLFALDGHHVADGLSAEIDGADATVLLTGIEQRIRECWRLAREAFRCPVIHQTPLAVQPTLLGNNEHRLPGSRHAFVKRLNAALRVMADEEGVDLLAIDDRAAIDGVRAWHGPGMWHRAKQEISPAAAPMYGELVGRLLAAQQGSSYKCLVLDLDNTIWGGVVGDDGLEGLVLGQGSALGEAFSAFQEYARELMRRGVILAVCSKNDETNALEPFNKHPEMVLRRGEIASFVANWSDKASNIRAIAQELNIGLDSLVFVDDNPFERELVRQELPMVAVPEVGDDPTLFPQILSDAGYFESLTVTDDDRARSGQYQSNRARETLKASATDLSAYLRSLEMELVWRRFDQIGLARTVQLINKTNQFNLATRRYSEEDVRAVMADPCSFGLQLRLIDRFGDNGIIAIIIGRMDGAEDLAIDTWLMSCRVLGRQVEPTTLNLIAAQASKLGAKRLVGTYIPTKKNAMVSKHYAKLGFATVTTDDGGSVNTLDLSGFVPADTFIHVKES